MATLGSHDKPLRGRILVDGVVTYRLSDFEIEVTKDERTASFFVPDEKMIMNWFETEDMRQAESQCAQAWVPTLVTQVEQCRREVSGLLLAEEDGRDCTIDRGSVLRSLRSVGSYAGET